MDPAKWLKVGKFKECQALIDKTRVKIENELIQANKLILEMETLVEFIWKERNTNWEMIFEDRVARPGELLGLIMKYFNYQVFSVITYQFLKKTFNRMSILSRTLFPIKIQNYSD